MKRIAKNITAACIAVTLFISAGLTQASDNEIVVLNNNGSEGHAIGIARAAVTSSCLAGPQGNMPVDVSASYSDGVWTVNFNGQVHCPPGAICILGFVRLATVQLDSDFNIINASCGGFWII